MQLNSLEIYNCPKMAFFLVNPFVFMAIAPIKAKRIARGERQKLTQIAPAAKHRKL